MKNLLTILFFSFCALSSFGQIDTNTDSNAQTEKDTTDLVQFSGMVVDAADQDKMFPLAFVSVAIKDTPRGTYSNFDGFFSIVAKKGEEVTFSAIGYKDVTIVVPDSLNRDRYSWVQLMSKDTFNLPMAVIYPWPSREHFKLEFLAMNTENPFEDLAKKNLKNVKYDPLRTYEDVPMDGEEGSKLLLKQSAVATYSNGQMQPMRIGDPLAWAKFIKAWKDGKFKKKKDDD